MTENTAQNYAMSPAGLALPSRGSSASFDITNDVTSDKIEKNEDKKLYKAVVAAMAACKVSNVKYHHFVDKKYAAKLKSFVVVRTKFYKAKKELKKEIDTYRNECKKTKDTYIKCSDLLDKAIKKDLAGSKTILKKYKATLDKDIKSLKKESFAAALEDYARSVS